MIYEYLYRMALSCQVVLQRIAWIREEQFLLADSRIESVSSVHSIGYSG